MIGRVTAAIRTVADKIMLKRSAASLQIKRDDDITPAQVQALCKVLSDHEQLFRDALMNQSRPPLFLAPTKWHGRE
jgi:hypothetical protein